MVAKTTKGRGLPTGGAIARPRGACCLTRFHKYLKGSRTLTGLGIAYDCNGVSTTQDSMTIKMDVRVLEGNCNETDLIPEYSVLGAQGTLTRRKDGFAYFAGSFTITFEDKKLFEGTIELLDRVGTHDGEDCDKASHLEGWLSGKKAGSTKATLRAALALRGKLPTTIDRLTSLDGNINGAIIECD